MALQGDIALDRSLLLSRYRDVEILRHALVNIIYGLLQAGPLICW
jgi:hypothetical protein